MKRQPYITLSVFDRTDHKLCDLYDNRANPEGQVSDFKVSSELHGWKE